MNTMEKYIDKIFGPVALFMNNSLFFRALTDSFMKMTPLTLGAAVLMVVGFFPIPSWMAWLSETGLYNDFVAVQNATLNALGLFLAFTFTYSYIKISNKEKTNPLVAGLLSLASFLMLMPQSYSLYQLEQTPTEFPANVTINGASELAAFSTEYVGPSGIIVAIIIGYLVARIYLFFVEKNFVVKLPDSVPSNVSESLSPTFLAGGILITMFLIRILFRFAPGLSQFNNIFHFITGVIQIPLQNIVGSPFSLIFIAVLANLFWYFGIHPNVVNSVVMPMILANSVANITAYTAGEKLPYLMFSIVFIAVGQGFGGQGSTIGLVLAMISSKSERYKEMFKLTIVPSIFNINLNYS